MGQKKNNEKIEGNPRNYKEGCSRMKRKGQKKAEEKEEGEIDGI